MMIFFKGGWYSTIDGFLICFACWDRDRMWFIRFIYDYIVELHRYLYSNGRNLFYVEFAKLPGVKLSQDLYFGAAEGGYLSDRLVLVKYDYKSEWH